MTPHKYPPLPQAQRDDDDRIGEILDTVRRIEARDIASPRGRIFAEVVAERERQEVKFPGQRLPLVDTASDTLDEVIDYLRGMAEKRKRDCDIAAKVGRCSWLLVHMEEVAESFLAMAEMQAGVGTKEAARAELIQVMAVCARILESEHFTEDNVVAEGGYTKG